MCMPLLSAGDSTFYIDSILVDESIGTGLSIPVARSLGKNVALDLFFKSVSLA